MLNSRVADLSMCCMPVPGSVVGTVGRFWVAAREPLLRWLSLMPKLAAVISGSPSVLLRFFECPGVPWEKMRIGSDPLAPAGWEIVIKILLGTPL